MKLATASKASGADPAFPTTWIAFCRNPNATNPAQPPATGGNLPLDEIKE
jgi:hypothetical protein